MHFSRALLSDESRLHGDGLSVLVKSQSFDMGMSRDALGFPAGSGLFRHLVEQGRAGGNTFIMKRGGDDYGDTVSWLVGLVTHWIIQSRELKMKDGVGGKCSFNSEIP